MQKLEVKLVITFWGFSDETESKEVLNFSKFKFFLKGIQEEKKERQEMN